MELDERGIPVFDRELHAASPECPPAPCQLCRDGFAWCQEMRTCAATINWDRIYGHD